MSRHICPLDINDLLAILTIVRKKLGKNIKSIRNKKKISQKVLCEKTGITIRHLLRIEKGEVDPSFTLVAKISSVLKVKIDDLIG